MIFELWNVRFDINLLQKHLQDHVLPLEATYQSSAFGGWSVLSSTGSHKDGWHKGHLIYDSTKNPEAVREMLQKQNVKKSGEYVVPTEICHGYLQEVVDIISSYGLEPKRARIIQLTAKQSSIWHQDYPPEKYGVRLHIPIVTNPGCFFETEEGRAHLSADGSAYFLAVNCMHRVVNEGETNRYHLVMDIVDTKGVTTHYRYSDFLAQQKSS